MTWIQHGAILEDDGDHSDAQVGKAASVRFRNPKLPGRLVTVYAYPAAPGGENGHGLDSLGIETQTEFMICDDIEEPGDTETWADYQYATLDTRPYDSDAAAAEKDALAWIQAFDANRDIHWDGEQF